MCLRCELQLECYRHTAVNALRSVFTKDWKSVFGVRPSRETFNSLLFCFIALADTAGNREW
jgi:hypothetical protein